MIWEPRCRTRVSMWQGEKILREVLEIERRVLGPDHPETLRSLENLAATLRQAGRYPESEKLERETLETLKRVLGAEHPQTLTSIHDLATTLQAEGGYLEAGKLCEDVLEVRRRVLGPNHPGHRRINLLSGPQRSTSGRERCCNSPVARGCCPRIGAGSRARCGKRRKLPRFAEG